MRRWHSIVMGIEVEVLEFDESVDTVDNASRLSGEPKFRIVKTLLLKCDHRYVVAVVRGDRRIDFDKLSQYLLCKVSLAKAREVREVLGVEIGAVSPLNDKVTTLHVVVDGAILGLDYVLCGGGSRKRLYRIDVDKLISFLNPVIIDDAFY